MRTLYLECRAGASGDMVSGALCGLLDDPKEYERMIAEAGIPGVSAQVCKAEASSISGLKVRITVNGEEEHQGGHHSHHHHHGDIKDLISNLSVSDRVKEDSLAIYGAIASVEAEVHGKPVNEVHFHEVGALDAVADVVGTCMLIERLGVEKIIASPLRTGFGTVECAHGTLPVPAPAAALLLRGVPVFAGDIEGEFTTPTGAALVSHFASEYGPMPMMTYEKVGIGFGSAQDTRIPDMLRAFIGDMRKEPFTITQIECNLDDMSPEDIGEAVRGLMEDGALDVSVAPIMMKKGRPGHLMIVLCRDKDRERIADRIMVRTSTIGVRMFQCERQELVSRFEIVPTKYGDIRAKISEGRGISKWKPEHADVLEASERCGVSPSEVRREVARAFKGSDL